MLAELLPAVEAIEMALMIHRRAVVALQCIILVPYAGKFAAGPCPLPQVRTHAIARTGEDALIFQPHLLCGIHGGIHF